MQNSLLWTISHISTVKVTPNPRWFIYFSYHAFYAWNKSSRATTGILNNDHFLNLIPKMRSQNYKFLNFRSWDWEINSGIAGGVDSQYPRKRFSSSLSLAVIEAAERPPGAARLFSLSRELSSMCCSTPTRMSICVHSWRSNSITWRMRANGATHQQTHPTHTPQSTQLPLPPFCFIMQPWE